MIETFRAELRGWLRSHAGESPGGLDDGLVTRQTLPVLREWNRKLADGGWAAPHWPAEHGGRDATVEQQLAYHEEMAAAGVPGPINVIGISNIAPAIMRFGSDEQKRAHLRPMLRGEEIWSQGMSEPDAGSDLASLRTRAERDGDWFVVNGQKTWNSLGHLADRCQLYVRTGPAEAKHRAITCLLVDMRTPGIEARPVKTIDGRESFAEVFFRDVRVPASAVLGGVDEGWTVAMTTLSHERAGVARLHLALGRKLAALLDAAGSIADPVARDRVARLHSDIAVMGWTAERFLAASDGTEPSPVAGSLAKLAWARADQRMAELALDLLGSGALGGSWATNLAATRQASIAGGTTEINLSIIGERGLGLPREPSA